MDILCHRYVSCILSILTMYATFLNRACAGLCVPTCGWHVPDFLKIVCEVGICVSAPEATHMK